MNKREIVTFAVLAVIGLALMVASRGSDLHFWTVCFPLMLCASGVAGYLEPDSYGLWGIAVVSLLPFACVFSGDIGPLFMVGVFVFGFVAVACWLSAMAGAALRRRRGNHQSE